MFCAIVKPATAVIPAMPVILDGEPIVTRSKPKISTEALKEPETFADPATSRVDFGFEIPIPTFPDAVMTNGVESGLVESSTTNALPVPVCVILRAFKSLLMLIVTEFENVDRPFPITFKPVTFAVPPTSSVVVGEVQAIPKLPPLWILAYSVREFPKEIISLAGCALPNLIYPLSVVSTTRLILWNAVFQSEPAELLPTLNDNLSSFPVAAENIATFEVSPARRPNAEARTCKLTVGLECPIASRVDTFKAANEGITENVTLALPVVPAPTETSTVDVLLKFIPTFD